MEMHKVESADVHAIGYDAKERLMVVEHLAGGVYHYLRVPREVFEEVLASRSKNAAVKKLVKGRFRSLKVR